ncbi:MAG TPA: UDP-N-acetylmuramoyl-L-alanine--D-glutamate ligase [Stellaceae bacterium]|nr:UDP-N-acetylmuramoyl-L-alanine--D-glutamate ligase [Stellaceae bacterium]
MIPVTAYANRDVMVLGLARSGLAAAVALGAGGTRVHAWDDAAERRAAAAERGVPIRDPASIEWRGMAALVISPGIPHTHPKPHPAAAAARAATVPILGDIELLVQSVPAARYIGVTGTNGKSTTTALIGHILKASGRKVEVGGNLGTPVLSFEPLQRDGVYVLEMSSYQLELTASLACDVAVLLNVTPDHLDRHGGMPGYIAAKRRIFMHQERRQTAVVGVDDEICEDVARDLTAAGKQQVLRVSAERLLPRGIYVTDGVLTDASEAAPVPVLEMRRAPRLPGRHNWQNAAAAYAASRRIGVSRDEAVAGIESFPGLAHRQELIATIDGIRYVNDSKATNADAAAKALACYEAIYWIAGGLPKEGGIESLRPYFSRIHHAFLIGTAAAQFAHTLGSAVPHSETGDLAAAVAAAARLARADARSGAVVLLSPACASFDQFANFEARGDAFRTLVADLRGARS